MAKGIVAGFVKRGEDWTCRWLTVNEPGVKRQVAMARALDQLATEMSWPGEAIARRNMVFVDGLCPNGRELIAAVQELLTKT